VINAFYFKPPFRASKEREEVLLSSMLSMKVPEENDPGEAALSRNWPNLAPGWEWCQDGRGQEAYPPQPIVSQTRAVLEAYARNGGS
jgi:hypothetical protein